MRNNEITLTRFGYRTTGLGISISVGAAIGGPPGAAVGTAIGVTWTGMEFIYDNMLSPAYDRISYEMWNFQKAMNGWHPRR